MCYQGGTETPFWNLILIKKIKMKNKQNLLIKFYNGNLKSEVHWFHARQRLKIIMFKFTEIGLCGNSKTSAFLFKIPGFLNYLNRLQTQAIAYWPALVHLKWELQNCFLQTYIWFNCVDHGFVTNRIGVILSYHG